MQNSRRIAGAPGGDAGSQLLRVSALINRHDAIIRVDALGLKRINASVEHDDSVIIKGMIARVKHLVKVEEVAPAKKAAPKAKKAEVKEEAAQAAE